MLLLGLLLFLFPTTTAMTTANTTCTALLLCCGSYHYGAAACSLGILLILERDSKPGFEGMEPRSLGRGVGAAAEEAPT